MAYWLRPVLILLALFGVPVSAYAQDQLAVDAYHAPWSEAKELKTLRHLAFCVVEKHPAAAQIMVREAGDDVILRKLSDQLIDPKCIKMFFFRSSTTRIAAPTYSPLLAEALLLRDYSSGKLPAFTGVEPLDHPALPAVDIDSVHPRYRDSFRVDRALLRLNKVTECAARARPDDVVSLAQTTPDSDDEIAAMDGLTNTIAVCESGNPTLQFPPFAVRGALITNLYRLADAARPVAYRGITP